MNKIKFLGMSGLSLCMICCLIPLVGIGIGSGTALLIGTYLQNIGLLLLGISAVLTGIFIYKKRKSARSCQTGCSCKPASEKW